MVEHTLGKGATQVRFLAGAYMRRFKPVDPKPGAPSIGNDWTIAVEEPSNTACKHGSTECIKCGTSQRQDALHTTVGGKGHVARLRGKK
jgi:hypothetical protein